MTRQRFENRSVPAVLHHHQLCPPFKSVAPPAFESAGLRNEYTTLHCTQWRVREVEIKKKQFAREKVGAMVTEGGESGGLRKTCGWWMIKKKVE